PLPRWRRRVVGVALSGPRQCLAGDRREPARRRRLSGAGAMSTPSATIDAPAREAALDVRELEVAYRVRGINRQVLRSLSFSIAAGESYGLVGESGCGKSTAALAAV